MVHSRIVRRHGSVSSLEELATDRALARAGAGARAGPGAAAVGDVWQKPTGGELTRLPLQAAPFPLRQPAPDAEALVVRKGVLETFRPHIAGTAHLPASPGPRRHPRRCRTLRAPAG